MRAKNSLLLAWAVITATVMLSPACHAPANIDSSARAENVRLNRIVEQVSARQDALTRTLDELAKVQSTALLKAATAQPRNEVAPDFAAAATMASNLEKQLRALTVLTKRITEHAKQIEAPLVEIDKALSTPATLAKQLERQKAMTQPQR